MGAFIGGAVVLLMLVLAAFGLGKRKNRPYQFYRPLEEMEKAAKMKQR